MTEARVREIMEAKGFWSNNGGLTVFYYGKVTAVTQHAEQLFRVTYAHPIKGWREMPIDFRNPIAAATYAMRHVVCASVRGRQSQR